MLNINPICASIKSSTDKIFNILNCKYEYNYPTSTDYFPIKEIDDLKRICVCIDDYKNAKIQSIDKSLIPIEVDSITIEQLNVVIQCLTDLIKNSRKEITSYICKLFEFDPSRQTFSYSTTIPTKYSLEEIIGYNAYLRLHDIYKQVADSPDILISLNEILNKYENLKYVKLLKSYNSQEHSYILQNCRLIFSNKSIYTNMFIIVPTVNETYQSIDNCINATFASLHPSLAAMVNEVCLHIDNMCYDSKGFGKPDTNTPPNTEINFDTYIEYNKVNHDLLKQLIKLTSLAKELEFASEVIKQTNQTQILISFWHLVSLAIYNKIIFQFYSSKFNDFIATHGVTQPLFVNNCVNSTSFLQLAYKLMTPNIIHEGFKKYFHQSLVNINNIDKQYQSGVFIRIPDIKNNVVIISMICGLYNQFLYYTDLPTH